MKLIGELEMVKIKEYFGDSNKDKKILQYTDNLFIKFFRRIVFGRIKFICNSCGKEAGTKEDLKRNKCMGVRRNKVYCWGCYHKN